MDPRFVSYYNQELKHLREMGAEFAKAYPKIAGRLGIEGLECSDPYVERLLEGFSFLAARIQLKIDAEFPRFTQHLFEVLCPNYLAPTPSMAVVQLNPSLSMGNLADGFPIPRQTQLRSLVGKGDSTPCEYRTAHDVTLYPLRVAEARLFPITGEFAGLKPSELQGVKSGLRIRLQATANLTIDKIDLDALDVYIRGSESIPGNLYELLFANVAAIAVLPGDGQPGWHQVLPASSLQPRGFSDADALLPYGSQTDQGYRLLHEYFAFPQRFLFARIAGLKNAVRRCGASQLDIVILLKKHAVGMEQIVSADNFALFCTPCINLFPKRGDRVHIATGQGEYHIVPDRTRPMDFEVYRIDGVTGHGSSQGSDRPFRSFYTHTDLASSTADDGYYQVRRMRRVLSERQKRQGPRSSYVGTEIFLALVDAREQPYPHDLRQLSVELLCTNRDLPLAMPLGIGDTDFTLMLSAPVDSVRVVSGPTTPVEAHPEGEACWRLVSHLSVNYLSLTNHERSGEPEALRDILRLYSVAGDLGAERQVEGLLSAASKPITRRLPMPGPAAFARGVEVKLTLDESKYEGIGAYLFAAVLEQFFARYVGINSFTETVVASPTRGEIYRWPTRIGRCEPL